MNATATNRQGILKLWLLNFFGNAAALAGWYCWLLIPDAHRWQVACSAVLALLIIFFVVWLRAGTLAWFRVAEFRNHAGIGAAFRRGLRHMIALAIWFALEVFVGWLIIRLGHYTPQFSVWIRQKVNAGPAPRNVMHGSDWLLFLLFWVVVPAVWLPVATTVSAVGFTRAHMLRSLRVLRQPLYWIVFCLLMALGAWVPYKLVTWVPELSTIRQQAWSAGLRFFAAYLILITAFLGLVWMVGERTDRGDPL
jgi:hypothetical protein